MIVLGAYTHVYYVVVVVRKSFTNYTDDDDGGKITKKGFVLVL